jgi:hypothetical protein
VTEFTSNVTSDDWGSESEDLEMAKKILPGDVRGIGAQAAEGATVSELRYGAAVSEKERPGFLGQMLSAGVNESPLEAIKPPQESEKSSADEMNKKYSPPGETLFKGPINEEAAKLISQRRYKEIRREDVLARYANERSWGTRMATGMIAQAADPLNAAAMFVPGIGEEALVGRYAVSMAARTAARAASSATGAAVAMTPQALIQEDIRGLEGQDFDMRTVLRELSMSAGLGAIIHAGFGLGREAGVLKPDELMRVGQEIANSTAAQKHVALSGTIAHLNEGKPGNIAADVLNPVTTPAAVVEKERQLQSNGYALGMSSAELARAKEFVSPSEEKPEVEREPAPPIREFAPAPREAPVIDNEHDVVSGAVANKDENVVYIDKRIPPTEDGINLHKYLAIHEQAEKDAMARGMSYDDAHTNVATPAERAAVEADGVSWAKYSEIIDGHLKDIEKEKIEKAPPNPHVNPEAAVHDRTGAPETAVKPTPADTTGVAFPNTEPVQPSAAGTLADLAPKVKGKEPDMETQIADAERHLTMAGQYLPEDDAVLRETQNNLMNQANKEAALLAAAQCIMEAGG